MRQVYNVCCIKIIIMVTKLNILPPRKAGLAFIKTKQYDQRIKKIKNNKK